MTDAGVLLQRGSFGDVHINTNDGTRVCKVSTIFYAPASKAEIQCVHAEPEELLATTNLRELVFYCTYQHPQMVPFHGFNLSGSSSKLQLHMGKGGRSLDRLHSNVGMRALLHDQHLQRICFQAGTLLRAIHTTNHVHGDLKPDNVLYDPETCKLHLIDWGAVMFCPDLRDPSELECTFLFESPESLCDRRRVSPAHDMWSWGLTMLVVLNGGKQLSWKLQRKRVGDDPDGRWVRASLQYAWQQLADRQRQEHAMDCLPVLELVTQPEALRYLKSDGAGALLLQLLQGLLMFDPEQRLSADVMLRHPWLQGETPFWPNDLPLLRLRYDNDSLHELQRNCMNMHQLRITTIHAIWIIVKQRSTWRAFVLGVHLWDRYRTCCAFVIDDPAEHLWWALLCHHLAAGVLLNYSLPCEATLRAKCPAFYRRDTVSDAYAQIIHTLRGRLYESTFDHALFAAVRPELDPTVPEHAVAWRLRMTPDLLLHVLVGAHYYQLDNAQRVRMYYSLQFDQARQCNCTP